MSGLAGESNVLRKIAIAGSLGGLLSGALAAADVGGKSSAAAFLNAMKGNLQMIQVDCPETDEPLPEGAMRLCLGPYWSWKEFRDRWDRSVEDPALVPEVPMALGGWRSEGGRTTRTYTFEGGRLQVSFDRSSKSVAIDILAPQERASPGAAEGAEPYADSPDTLPEAIPESRLVPVYPARARQVRSDVRVVLDVLVAASGEVEGVIVQSCSLPGRGFEDSAVEAVRRWRFRPALRGGKPVGATARVSVVFAARP